MQSFHDHWLTGYAVDGEKRMLTLRLSEDPRTTEAPYLADLLFEGVQDYFLEHDLGENIVYSIREKSIEIFLNENSEDFVKQSKWAWPKFWKGDVARTQMFLSSNRCRVWELQSSYGLSGWVVATQVQELARVA